MKTRKILYIAAWILYLFTSVVLEWIVPADAYYSYFVCIPFGILSLTCALWTWTPAIRPFRNKEDGAERRFFLSLGLAVCLILFFVTYLLEFSIYHTMA